MLQHQDVVESVLGESVKDARRRGVIGTRNSGDRWSRGWSEVGLEEGDMI